MVCGGTLLWGGWPIELVLALFIQTPKVTCISSKAILDANALLTLLIYTRQTQQSAQSFRPFVSGEFNMTPLVGNQGIIVNAQWATPETDLV